MGYAETLVTAQKELAYMTYSAGNAEKERLESKRTVGDSMPAPIGSMCLDAAGQRQPKDSMLPPKKRKHKALEAPEQSPSLLLSEPSVAFARDSQRTASVRRQKGGEERGSAVKEDADLEADARLALALQEEENVRHATASRSAYLPRLRLPALIAEKDAHTRVCRPVPVAGDPSQGLKAKKHWQGAQIAARAGGGGPWL
jgi:hypothetical protein